MNSEYAATTGQIGGSYATTAPKESTQIEKHLESLNDLQANAQNAVLRACKVADRLLGPEPTSIGNTSNGLQNKISGELPLVVRMETSAGSVRDYLGQLHSQLARLERL